MPNMHKVFADYEVLTADDVNDYLMNQVIVKVDTSTDLSSLPTEVKTAYVVDTGLTMARNVVDAWVPLGGLATVSATAPSNPQTGQLWVMPSQSLPAPGVGALQGSSTAVTGLNSTYVAIGGTYTFSNGTGRSIKALISWGSTFIVPGTGGSTTRARLNWSGATTGNSFDLSGNHGLSVFIATDATDNYESTHRTFAITLNTGDTTFQVAAGHNATSTPANPSSYGNSAIQVCPLGFADQWA